MSVTQNSEFMEEERQMARTIAISLGAWLAVTVLAVVLLLLFGEPLSSLVV
ncbi:hypothetical protein BDK88_2343 [Natrinema hispanicum]|uniref:Uncharacterized protein n=1 Tax=Natrinema hispanicum TaxID=392421 RepID=A0A482YDW2_9EURY|nr:hypothetical protein [Natrinema hispanicum]RZV11110.1 hypothetical protein BDK88_2343 [Natrinema hispanicum]